MANAGAFSLLVNDGRADRMLMATALLNQRIKDVMCARERAQRVDITPTLYDIEKTHILFVNKSFKPFAAVAYEYNKVHAQSGTATTIGENNKTVMFNIPQFGDFFHDMVVHVILAAYSFSTDLTTPATSAVDTDYVDYGTTAGTTVAIQPERGTATGEAYSYSWTDVHGTNVDVAATYNDYCRYCEYPGNRLFHLVKFDVNGNPLDEYDEIVSIMLQKFTVPDWKEYGYNRLVGQENVLDGWSGPHIATVTDQNIANTPAGFIATTDTMRYKLNVVNGPQTPKATQPALEIWNKLRFWFNDDVGLAIPSVSIPFGQRFITIELCKRNELIFPFPNLYLKTRTLTWSTLGMATAVLNSFWEFAPVTYDVTFEPYNVTATYTDITVSTLEMYVNNIFVNPEIHDIFIKRVGFTLIRVYRRHEIATSQATSDEHQMSMLKWPVEYLFIGLRPDWNVCSTNREQWRDWHRLTRAVSGEYDNGCSVEIPYYTFTSTMGGTLAAAIPTSVMANLATSLGHWGFMPYTRLIATTGQVVKDSYTIELPTINTITVTAHGIKLYDNFEDRFHNAYQPFHFGGPGIVTPKDPGALMVNFCLYPRSYQPSSHVNISRAREFFIKWETSYVSSNTPAHFYAIAVCINFLLITDGSAVLRYST